MAGNCTTLTCMKITSSNLVIEIFLDNSRNTLEISEIMKMEKKLPKENNFFFRLCIQLKVTIFSL